MIKRALWILILAASMVRPVHADMVMVDEDRLEQLEDMARLQDEVEAQQAADEVICDADDFSDMCCEIRDEEVAYDVWVEFVANPFQQEEVR